MNRWLHRIGLNSNMLNSDLSPYENRHCRGPCRVYSQGEAAAETGRGRLRRSRFRHGQPGVVRLPGFCPVGGPRCSAGAQRPRHSGLLHGNRHGHGRQQSGWRARRAGGERRRSEAHARAQRRQRADTGRQVCGREPRHGTDRHLPEDGIRRRPPCAPRCQDRPVGEMAGKIAGSGLAPPPPTEEHRMTETERMSRSLSQVDPEIYQAIQHETARQDGQLELIASENFTSEAVLEATGSVFTNKYAEGYPGKRYYGGCEYTDVVENLARERAKKLFGAEYVNVQPHSGSQANQAAYGAVLTPGDTIMGLNLAHGGHLTHGHPLNFSGKLYKVVPYNVRKEDERIDYDEVERLAKEHRPKLIVAGASAYPRMIDFARFRQIADLVGAVFLVDMAHISGLVAAGVHPNPCEHADIVTTTTHKTLRGPRGGMILAREKYGKDIDRNVFPGTQGGPLVHVLAAKAVCFLEAMQPEFVAYQKRVVANARVMALALMDAGFRVVSGGTDTHLVLLDVFSKGLRGKEAELALDRARITVNKNAIPFDTNPPMTPSGSGPEAEDGTGQPVTAVAWRARCRDDAALRQRSHGLRADANGVRQDHHR